MRPDRPCGPPPCDNRGVGLMVDERARVRAGDADVDERAKVGVKVLGDSCRPHCVPHQPSHAPPQNGTPNPHGAPGAHAQHAPRGPPCPPPPCPPMRGIAVGAGAHVKAGDMETGTHTGTRVERPPRPAHNETPHPEGRPCAPPCAAPGRAFGLHEQAGARVKVDDVEVGARERVDVGLGRPAPCHPPCQGVGVREGADARVRVGNATVGAGEHAGLRLGEGCRREAGNPNEPHMQAARRAHALESAMEVLNRRLERLEDKMAQLEEKLGNPDATGEEMARIQDALDRLDKRQDDVLERIQGLAEQLAGLLDRWSEEVPEGWESES